MIKEGKFIGKVLHKGEPQTIKTDFIKMTIVIEEAEGEYKQSMAIDFSNQGIKFAERVNVGDFVEVEVKFKASEYQGKYYNNLKGWTIKKIEMGGVQVEGSDNEDLPF